MNIELKNVKHFPSGSQETNCFTANLYLDGKKIGSAENDGHGGCTFIHGDTKQIKAIDSLIKRGPKIHSEVNNITFDNSIELVVDELLMKFLFEQETKKVLRRVSYIKDGALYQMPAKIKPDEKTLREVKLVKWWKDEYILLNELTFDDVTVVLIALDNDEVIPDLPSVKAIAPSTKVVQETKPVPTKVVEKSTSKRAEAEKYFGGRFGKDERKVVISYFVEVIGLTKSGASTYYQNFKKAAEK